jgi:uncharacterized tellurite resistance protein B-like protein
MGILLGLLAVLGAVGMILWRLNQASGAARELAETAGEVQGFFRRRKWQKKFAGDPLQLIDDPRAAAAAIMAALAQADGAISEAEQAVIVKQMCEKFGAKAPAAEELLAHARWAVRDIVEVDSCVRRLLPVIERTCGPQEREQLIEMLEAVAAANGQPAASERLAVERIKRVLRHQAA